MGWDFVKLGDLVHRKIGYGIVQPGSSVDVGVPVIKVNNIISGLSNIELLEKTTTEIDARYTRTRLVGGEIVISLVGSVGKTAIVPKTFAGCNLVRATGLIDIKDEILAKWVKYYIDSPLGQAYINSNVNTTVQVTLNIKSLVDMPIPLPEPSIREKIVAILSSIDDKIELNRRINANLEQQAQALYKSWFVDNNTNKIRLEEVVKTTSGGTPSRSHTEYYGGNYGWIKSKELNGSFISKTEESITDLAILKSSAKILPEMSVLIAMYGATVGQYAITSKPMTCNQAICALLPNENYPYTYLFMVAKNKKEELINNAVGSAQQNISQVIIKDLLISNDIAKIKEFHNKVAPIFGIIRKNTEENINLSTLRDTLLPKLMSGEIKV